jgi:hypothetical protein
MVPATHARSLDDSLFFSTSRINVAPRLAWSCPFAYVAREPSIIKMLESIGATISYKFLLDSMEHAFEHCRILPVPTLGLSLPFRQSYEAWGLRQLIFDGLRNAHLLGICLIQVKNSTKCAPGDPACARRPAKSSMNSALRSSDVIAG